MPNNLLPNESDTSVGSANLVTLASARSTPRLANRLFGMFFAATSRSAMQPLRGVADTFFKMLDWRRGLAGPAVDAIFQHFQVWVGSRRTIRKPDEYLRVFQAVFHGVAQAQSEALYHGTRCVVGFLSSSKAFTKRPGTMDMPGHAVFTLVLDFLREHGYVTVDISPGQLRCSFLEPTDRFPSFDQVLQSVILSKSGLVTLRTGRESGKQPVDPRDYTPEQAEHIAAIEQRLVAINEHALRYMYHVFEAGAYCQLHSANAMYHIVYNDESIARGGRLCCALQNLPQRNRTGDPAFVPMRSTLHIDGKPTVELDYRSQHFSFMYNLKGLSCPDACYEVPIDGWDVPLDDPVKAGLVKTVFLALPNCGATTRSTKQNNRSAIQTIEGRIKHFDREQMARRKRELSDIMERFSGENPQGSDEEYEEVMAQWRSYLVPPDVTPALLRDCLIRHHPLIADLLYSGIGSFLQSIDARIAMRVIERFNAMGRPILGVHDSFRVWAEDTALLRTVMTEEYEAEFPGFKPGIKQDAVLTGLPPFPA